MRNVNLQQNILAILLTTIFFASSAGAVELVIGEERVRPGIVFIFEGAVKDHVLPMKRNLPEEQTHVHIEARVNWGERGIPEGTPPGGFVPYLRISAKVTNENSGLSTFVDLIPHINLIDNFHYARNITLPGKVSDYYTVSFFVLRPTHMDLSLHRDWLQTYGRSLTSDHSFTYRRVDFEEIAKASR